MSQATIAKMFSRISPTYDRVNRVLSFGIDRWWRKKLATCLRGENDLTLLDLATGTGDQLVSILRHCPNIERAHGFDISKEMLDLGKEKVDRLGFSDRVDFSVGDASQLPFGDRSFDAISISFGIRNVVEMDRALKEMVRVLSDHGVALILEFSKPHTKIVRSGYFFYLRHLLPRIGKILSKEKEAYRYLNTSIEAFIDAHEMTKRLLSAGFSSVEVHRMTFGVVSLYVATK